MRKSLFISFLIVACSSTPQQPVVTRSEKLAMHPDCPAEAARFFAGLDTDGDGALADGEATSTVVVCASAEACTTDSSGAEIRVTCPNHPVVVIPKPSSPGHLVVVKDAPSPAPCPRGGHLVQSGLDDGPGPGEAGDGMLQPSEVDATRTLCAAFCGDGTRDTLLGEECDDGNNVDRDGCTARCGREPVCVPPTPDPGCPPASYHVESISPGTGPTTGAAVTLTGDFPSNTALGNTVVTLTPGGPATVTAASPTVVTFTMPAGTGDVSISLTVATAVIPFWRLSFAADGEVAVTMANSGSFSYRAPVISSVAGCMNAGASTTGCPVAGGTTLTITGSDFGASTGVLSVLVGGAVCTNVALTTPHTALTCTLPAAGLVGYDVPVTVSVAGVSSPPAALLSYAVPVITPGSLRLAAGSPMDPLVLASNLATAIAFDATGLPGSSTGVTVRFGAGRATYDCGGVTLPSAGTVQCTTAPAVGRELRVAVCVDGRCSRPSVDRLTFPAPVIQGGTLRSSLGGPGSTSLAASASVGERVFFDVRNLIDQPPQLEVTYGPYACASTGVHGAGPTYTIECVTTFSSGGPHTFVVQAANQASAPGTDVIVFPVAPAVTRVEGCAVNSGGATSGCPTEGGVRLTIQGSGFAAGSLVTVGGAPCTEVALGDTTQLTCVLPPGVGRAAVSVAFQQLRSNPVELVGYAAPVVTRVSGCNDVGNTTEGCPRAGGAQVSIEGANFGASGAVVLVGGRPCTQVAHDAAAGHRRLTCTLPAGAGRNQPVYVINGNISAAPFYVHYAP